MVLPDPQLFALTATTFRTPDASLLRRPFLTPQLAREPLVPRVETGRRAASGPPAAQRRAAVLLRPPLCLAMLDQGRMGLVQSKGCQPPAFIGKKFHEGRKIIIDASALNNHNFPFLKEHSGKQ